MPVNRSILKIINQYKKQINPRIGKGIFLRTSVWLINIVKIYLNTPWIFIDRFCYVIAIQHRNIHANEKKFSCLFGYHKKGREKQQNFNESVLSIYRALYWAEVRNGSIKRYGWIVLRKKRLTYCFSWLCFPCSYCSEYSFIIFKHIKSGNISSHNSYFWSYLY